MLVILSISIVALIAFASVVYKKNIENEIASEIEAFDNYVDENGGSSVSDVKAMYNFIKDYSHKNEKVESELLYYTRTSINDSLEFYFEGGHAVIESLEEIDYIMTQPYINPSIEEMYSVAVEEARERREYLLSLTDEDMDKIIEHNANFVDIGYTENEVVEKLGKPYDITTSTSAYGVSKVFEYEDRFIYFVDGEVTRVVDF